MGALITSVNSIREEHPIVNDIYEKKTTNFVIFVLGNVFKSEEKDEYILNCRINEEFEQQKYVNKPYGIYYIDKKTTEVLNSKGFQLPRGFNLNGLINTIQGQSLIVKKNEAIKKEGKVAIQTVIAQYGFTQGFSEIRNQVVALITSINSIREEHLLRQHA